MTSYGILYFKDIKICFNLNSKGLIFKNQAPGKMMHTGN
jgi:hypothetical protein